MARNPHWRYGEVLQRDTFVPQLHAVMPRPEPASPGFERNRDIATVDLMSIVQAAPVIVFFSLALWLPSVGDG